MDAIDLLRAEHKAVKDSMFLIGRSVDVGRKVLFTAFKREFELHDGIEADIFYPMIATNSKTFGLHGMEPEARRVVYNALRNLDALPYDSKDWFPYFRAIQGIVVRQIDQEEFKVFERVREAFGPIMLGELGRRMAHERQLRSGAATPLLRLPAWAEGSTGIHPKQAD
jgi:hypothetical protein